MSKVIGIIPARYQSTRFPGKPLTLLNGKTLIETTYSNSKQCKILDELMVATDDERIFKHVKEFGGNAVMTSQDCPTGTDRLIEVIESQNLGQPQDIFINIQGDVPCIDASVLGKITKTLQDQGGVMATAAVAIKSDEELRLPSVVKCVIDQNGNALYFSRAPLAGSYHHLGIYAFRKHFLMQYRDLPITPLQRAEDLEQLKVLEHGYNIRVAVVQTESHGVDRPEDIPIVEEILCRRQNLSL